MTNKLQLLRNERIFWSRLGICINPCRLNPDGSIYDQAKPGDDKKFAAYHKQMRQAGIRVHSSIISLGWTGPDMSDYTLTDRALHELFSAVPDALYIPRIKLDAPLLWSKKNPEELCVYHGGPTTAEEIAAIVDTPVFDCMGYDSLVGYEGLNDTRTNIGGLVSNQSFCSTKWRQDAGEALRRFIHHLQSSAYGDRIIGYHIAYGICGETHLWGHSSWMQRESRIGDYGITTKRKFYQWGLHKYGSQSALQDIWQQPELADGNIELPEPYLRLGLRKRTLHDFMRHGDEYAIVRDYELFMEDANINSIKSFCDVVKDVAGADMPTGCFYGYVLGPCSSAYSGHAGYDKILDCPSIDFICGPADYHRRGPGEPGGFQAITQSIAHRKIWIDEVDMRTHVAGILGTQKFGACNTLQESLFCITREVLKNLSYDLNYWHMDLGDGWYNSPELLEAVKKLTEFSAMVSRSKHHYHGEILIVFDDRSELQHPQHFDHQILVKDLIAEARLTGTTVDVFRLSDIEDIASNEYGFVIFLNCYKITEEQQASINKLLLTAKVTLWHYLAGMVNESTCSVSNIHDTCRFTVEESALELVNPAISFTAESPFTNCQQQDYVLVFEKCSLPAVKVLPGADCKTWALFSNGLPALSARRNHDNTLDLYSVLPLLKSEHLRILSTMAGCHHYAPEGCIVYGDNRFVGIFAKKACKCTIEFPLQTRFHDYHLNGAQPKENEYVADLQICDFKIFLASGVEKRRSGD